MISVHLLAQRARHPKHWNLTMRPTRFILLAICATAMASLADSARSKSPSDSPRFLEQMGEENFEKCAGKMAEEAISERTFKSRKLIAAYAETQCVDTADGKASEAAQAATVERLIAKWYPNGAPLKKKHHD